MVRGLALVLALVLVLVLVLCCDRRARVHLQPGLVGGQGHAIRHLHERDCDLADGVNLDFAFWGTPCESTSCGVTRGSCP